MTDSTSEASALASARASFRLVQSRVSQGGVAPRRRELVSSLKKKGPLISLCYSPEGLDAQRVLHSVLTRQELPWFLATR